MSAETTPALPLPLIAADAGWLVIEKPAGLSVHNDPGRDVCSLLAVRLRAGFAETACDPDFGVHAVHRLDRETSGLLLLACRREVFETLSGEFSQGRVEKEYLVLSHGRLPAGSEGIWRWPLSASAAGRRNPQGPSPRVPSITHFRSLRCGRRYTLLTCRPVTGRQHQIRRHAALAGHPVLGDQRYGPARACRYLAERHNFTRLALHAAALTLKVPGSETPRRFESPALPAAIRELLDHDG